MNIADPLDRLPHFNPDLDVTPAPAALERWRNEVAAADAVLICSPEYAFGVPGVAALQTRLLALAVAARAARSGGSDVERTSERLD